MQDGTEEQQKEWIDRGESSGGSRLGVTCCEKACSINPSLREFYCKTCDFTITLEKLMAIHGLSLAYNLVEETKITDKSE